MNTITECRNCRKEITLSHGQTYKNAEKQHFYGGFVCSTECENAVSNRMRKSQDDHAKSYGRYL